MGEYRTGFLLRRDAMVMPGRVGEGGREKKGNGEGNAVKSWGACGEEDEGPGSPDAAWRSEVERPAC